MGLLKSKGTATLVIVGGQTFSEKEITDEFKSMSFRQFTAMIQLIDGFRQEHAASAARSAVQNNALSMASDIGAYEALSGLIEELNERRSEAD